MSGVGCADKTGKTMTFIAIRFLTDKLTAALCTTRLILRRGDSDSLYTSCLSLCSSHSLPSRKPLLSLWKQYGSI